MSHPFSTDRAGPIAFADDDPDGLGPIGPAESDAPAECDAPAEPPADESPASPRRAALFATAITGFSRYPAPTPEGSAGASGRAGAGDDGPHGGSATRAVKLCVVGSGYVGLVSGACFASHGHDVVCVDLDAARVAAINAGRSGLHEPGLDDLVRRQVDAGCLRATGDLASAVRASDLTLLCVPTPLDADAGRINLAYVRRAAGQVGAALRGLTRPHAVVVKSTCVPGTAETVVGPIVREASGRPDVGIGANPEFLSEGTAVDDFLDPDRIVIGGDESALRLLARLHGGFDPSRVVRVSAATAEAIKYASNALLATAVSFANEVGDVCEATAGVDVAEVMDAVHRSRYLTVACGGADGGADGGVTKQAGLARFLEAGCGYGGSCLPKDTRALAGYAASRGVATPLLDAVSAVNESRPARVLAAIRRAGLALDGLPVAVLGTAFKAGTADVRQSPATAIVEALLAAGAHVTTFDPAANENTRRSLGSRVDVADTLEGAVAAARAVVVAVAWPEFDALADLLRGRDRPPIVIDGRRRLDPDGFGRYAGVGRSPLRTTDL